MLAESLHGISDSPSQWFPNSVRALSSFSYFVITIALPAGYFPSTPNLLSHPILRAASNFGPYIYTRTPPEIHAPRFGNHWPKRLRASRLWLVKRRPHDVSRSVALPRKAWQGCVIPVERCGNTKLNVIFFPCLLFTFHCNRNRFATLN